jgi:hypothetical protein
MMDDIAGNQAMITHRGNVNNGISRRMPEHGSTQNTVFEPAIVFDQ